MSDTQPAVEAVIDLDAYRHNLAVLSEAAGDAALMAVVKADGYGHGMVECASVARDEGVPWLGVSTLGEALALRAAGDRGRLLCWLALPGENYAAAYDADIDVTASSAGQLDEIASVANDRGTMRVHLKVDTGLARNGAYGRQWDDLVDSAAHYLRNGAIEVAGVWSHLACADDPGHPSIDQQQAAFDDAVQMLHDRGIHPGVRHLANSAATLTRPSARYDLVRAGIASYGLSPVPQVSTSAQLGLRPVMTLRGRLAHVKRVTAGSGVSYGHTHVLDQDTTLGLVPVGYGDGIIRLLSNRASVWAAGAQRPILGRVCMDQFTVGLGDDEASIGDQVILFGTGRDGEPTAQDWADAAETISYEVVTRIGGRIGRRYEGKLP